MDSLDEEERLDPRVKRTVGVLETWEHSHLDELKEQKRNAVQALSDAEIGYILDRIVPDGGVAWLLVLSTWISNGITNGVGFSFGLLLSGIVEASESAAKETCLQQQQQQQLNVSECSSAQSRISLPLLTTVGTVHTCLLYLTTPVILLHSNRVGRQSDFAFMGALLSTLGLFLSALTDYSRHSGMLLLHFSVTAGLGLAIQTTLQATILSHNFNRRMSIAAGITSSGNGMFSGLLSIGINALNATMGVRFSFALLTCLSMTSLLYTQFWRSNRDFLLLQKWVRTPVPLFKELLTARVMHNRRYLVLFLSVLCVYSGLFYPWFMLMQFSKNKFANAQLAQVPYVYMVRGFANALLRCLIGFAGTAEWVRARLLYFVPVNQSMYLWGLLALIIGLQTASLPMLFLSAGLTALGESLVITTMPSLIAKLTNPADTPAGLVLMNLTYSLASLLPPSLLSIVTESLGGNFLPAFVVCCCFSATGVLLGLSLAVRMPFCCGGAGDSGGGGGGGDADNLATSAGANDVEGYIALDATMSPALGAGSRGGGRTNASDDLTKSGADQDGWPASNQQSVAKSRVRSAAPGAVSAAISGEKNRSISQRAVKHNAYKVAAWRQQECNVGRECFEAARGD